MMHAATRTVSLVFSFLLRNNRLAKTSSRINAAKTIKKR
jgi:hypothetical protein